MTSQTLPLHGQTIIFQKTPTGSYTRTGEAYRVDRPNNKGEFRFVSVARGSATYDRPNNVLFAVWQAA